MSARAGTKLYLKIGVHTIMEKTNSVQKNHKLLDHPILAGAVIILIKMALVNLFFFLVAYVIDWNPKDPFLQGLIDFFTSVIPAILLTLFVKYRLGDNFRLGFNRKYLLQGLILFVWVVVPQLILAGMSLFTYNGTLAPAAFLTALLAGFGPGISEELLTRSIALGNMERCWREKKDMIYKTVIFSAMIFGLMHIVNIVFALVRGLDMTNVIPQVINQVIYNFGIGIFYGAVYMRTHNIWPCIIAHSLFDACSGIISATGDATSAGTDNAVETIISGNFSWMRVIATIGYLVVYAGVGLFLIRPKKHEEILSRWSDGTSSPGQAL